MSVSSRSNDYSVRFGTSDRSKSKTKKPVLRPKIRLMEAIKLFKSTFPTEFSDLEFTYDWKRNLVVVERDGNSLASIDYLYSEKENRQILTIFFHSGMTVIDKDGRRIS